MSDEIFQAVDEVSSQGIEAMLREAIRVASDEHNYLVVCEAKSQLKRLELELPKKAESREEFESRKDSWQQLDEAKKQFQTEAAENYRRNGKFKEAALFFINAERFRDAIDMYALDGSDNSLDRAVFYAIQWGIDPKIGFDLRIEREQFEKSFSDLDNIRLFSDFGHPNELRIKEKQQWGEYITRAVYITMIDKIKAEIEAKEGKKPKSETIPQLLESGYDLSSLNCTVDISSLFSNAYGYIRESADPEILQIGIELNAFLARSSLSRNEEDYERNDMFLRGKLTGSEDCIQYFIGKAEEEQASNGDGLTNVDARRAIEILEFNGKYGAALEIAERFLPKFESIIFGLLEKIRDPQRLATAYRENNNPIEYALAMSER